MVSEADTEAQYNGPDRLRPAAFEASASDALSRVMTETYSMEVRQGQEEAENQAAAHNSEKQEVVFSSRDSNSSNSSSHQKGSYSDTQGSHTAGFFHKCVHLLKNILNPKLESHKSVLAFQFCFTNVLLATVCLSIICIYWGAAYRTEHYLFKVNILSVIQDQDYNNIQSMASTLPALIDQTPGTWHLYNRSSFVEKYGIENTSEAVDKKITDLIFEEKYWMSLNVKTGATEALYNSLTDNTAPAFNSSAYFECMFESGRDPTNLKSAILPIMQQWQAAYVQYYTSTYLPSMLRNVSATINSIGDVNPLSLANSGNFEFNYIDYRPFFDRVLLAPLQVGLIFTLILTVVQLSLYGPMHAKMVRVFKPKHFLLYRYGLSWSTYFILSLFFCTVSAIYQIDFTLAFGRGGFVIYWITTFYVMLAIGATNENVISLIVAYCPQYMPIWLISWIILNISPSFYPMVLNNQFYRYGYAMPLHNAVDIYRVIFLDLSRNKLGRNYGILTAWVAVTHIIFPFVMKIAGTKMKSNAMKQAQATIAAYEAKKNQS